MHQYQGVSRSPGPAFMNCFLRRLSYITVCIFNEGCIEAILISLLHDKSLRYYASKTISCGTRPYPAFSELPKCKDSIGKDLLGSGVSSAQFPIKFRRWNYLIANNTYPYKIRDTITLDLTNKTKTC